MTKAERYAKILSLLNEVASMSLEEVENEAPSIYDELTALKAWSELNRAGFRYYEDTHAYELIKFFKSAE